MCAAKLRIVGISGSLRAASNNSGLLRAARQFFPSWVEYTIADIKDIPVFNEDIEANTPAQVVKLREQLLAADGILFASPENNYGVSAALKNAIDWASRPTPAGARSINDKAFAIVSSGGGLGGGRSHLPLRGTMVFLNGMPVNKDLVVRQYEAPAKFDAKGDLIDEASRNVLKGVVEALVDTAIVNKQRAETIKAFKASL